MKKIILFLGLIFSTASALFAGTESFKIVDSAPKDAVHHPITISKLEMWLSDKNEAVFEFPRFAGAQPENVVVKIDDSELTLAFDQYLLFSPSDYGGTALNFTFLDKNGKEIEPAVPTKTLNLSVYKKRALVKNEAVLLGILLLVLAFVFSTSSSQKKGFKAFYKYIPALLLCYFIPAILNSLHIIDGERSQLYFVASRYLLPASLVLLCLSIDLKGIINLGPKALIMFFAATLGIVLGGPFGLWIMSQFEPGLLGGTGEEPVWKGLATVAGSWIGGGANQAAMKEIAECSNTLFGAMIVVDVVIANLWMAFLLYGAGISDKVDKWLKADNSAITALKSKVEGYQKSIAKVPTFLDYAKIIAIAFGAVAAAHFLADLIGPAIGDFLKDKLAKNPESGWKFFTSLKSGFFWLVVFATAIGVGLSFTRHKKLEGAGASKIGSIFLYILVATIGMHMDIVQIIDKWPLFKFILSIGFIWMAVHIVILLVVAKIVKAPFFFVAVGSQANVGGAASAPVVASAFSPSLATVGVLLAVFGYAVGTFGAILCMGIMQAMSM